MKILFFRAYNFMLQTPLLSVQCRWNLTGFVLRNTNLRTPTVFAVYRETALMYAMSAAALTHVVAESCAKGTIRGCRCREELRPEDTRRIWRWQPCGDNFSYGRRFTRRFTQMGQWRTADYLHDFLVRHNMNVGIQVSLKQGLPRIHQNPGESSSVFMFYDFWTGNIKTTCILLCSVHIYGRFTNYSQSL